MHWGYRSVLSLWISTTVWAAPFGDSLDLGLSTSQSYEARNIFLNPAALGFESALNGNELSSTLLWGSTPVVGDDLGLGLTWGPLGFGVDRAATAARTTYSFALGTAASETLFLGTRLRLLRFDAAAGQEHWDLGLQFRPSQKFALGLVVESVNRPFPDTVLSATLRPTPGFDFTVDVTTPASAFFRTVQAQAMFGWEFMPGAILRLGYHGQVQFVAGLQIQLGHASIAGSFQPSTAGSNRPIIVALNSSTLASPSSVSPEKTIKVAVGSSLAEEGSPGGFFVPSTPSLLQLLTQLQQIEADPTVSKVALRLESFPLGLASAQEVHQALRRLRDGGKSVEVFLGSVGMKEYLIAAAANRIVLEPAGEIRWLGVRSERYFVRGTLDKLGVQPEFLAAGKYKSAPEMFTRHDLSEPAKTATLEELRSTESALREVLAKSKGIQEAGWEKLSKLALLSAQEARNAGLIDDIGSFTSEISKREKQEWILPWEPQRKTHLALPARIAVVVAEGNIMPSSSRWLRLSGNAVVTPSGMEKKLQAARRDRRTQAVVLRVSSPGGEVMASQQIAQRVADLADVKPLLVSMGDVAASGGYYIAAPAKRVYAGSMTLTGSIGVFLGKFDFGGFYRWIGVNKEVLSDSPYPSLYSEHRAWSEGERAVMQRRLDNYYEDFLAHVSKYRSLDAKAARNAAEGRVWTGAQASTRGLVDQIGGYHEAIQAAADAAHLDADEYEVVEIQLPMSLVDQLTPDVWATAPAPSALSLLLPKETLPKVERLTLFRDHPFQYVTPVSTPE